MRLNYYYLRDKNTPVATLIRRYTNKKSGKVVDARIEIQRRFDYLDWKDQKKILFAFLESGKSDRDWAYLKLLDFWDEVFGPKVKELWEQLHEEKCSWVVIHHFPAEYLSENIDQFSGKRNYYFICLRLARDKNFVIDKEKLSPKDYLAVLYHTNRKIDRDEAENLLYETVHRVCMKCHPDFVPSALDKYADKSVGSIISPINISFVNIIVYYLRKMNCRYVLLRFEQWNEMVQKRIAESPEFKKVLEDGLTDEEYLRSMLVISRRYAYKALPQRYKKPTDPPIDDVLNFEKEHDFDSDYEQKLEELQQNQSPADPDSLQKMKDKNPNIEELIEGLDLVEEIPF